MSQPLISVILPIYHPNYHYFKESLFSLLNQNYKNLEILLISDGHSKKIEDLLYKISDKRIHLVINNKRLGFTKSLNVGIELSRGPYIARQDSDDLSEPKRFILQMNYLINNNLHIVGSDTIMIDENNRILGLRHYPHSYNGIKNDILKYCPFAHSSILMKKSILFQSGMYNDSIKVGEDYELWLRLVSKYKCGNISIPLVKVRNRKNSLKGEKLFILNSLAWRIIYVFKNFYPVNFGFIVSVLLYLIMFFIPSAFIMHVFNLFIKNKYFNTLHPLRII